jgi:hypothetical protein
MPGRLKEEGVKAYLKENGCKLLTEYVNTKTNITILCKCGHERISRFGRIKFYKQFNCKKCTHSNNFINKYSKSNEKIKGGEVLHPKTYTARAKLMEFKIKKSKKYKLDFHPDNYNDKIKCWDCGKEKYRRLFLNKKRYKNNKGTRCKKCASVAYNDRRSRYGKREFLRDILQSSKQSAKKRCKLGRTECGEHTITIQDLENLLEKQNNRCIYSGREFVWEYNHKYKASLDRIDSSKGYTPNNIQFTTWICNQAKSDFSEADFIEMCKDVNKNIE